MRSAKARSFACLAVALAFAVAVPAATAQVNVGDELDPTFKTTDGTVLTAKQLKGRLVLLDFWATWCGPCVKAAPHMVALNEKFGEQGLQIIGISLDRDPEALQRGVKDLGFTWPQVLDTSGQISGQFGVEAIPSMFLLGPDATVVWVGRPGELLSEQTLAELMEKHPPVLVDPKVVQAARETLAQVTEKLEAGDAKAALKLMAKVPAGASRDAEFAEAAAETGKKLDEAAAGLLGGAEEAIEAGKFVEAADRLRELSVSLAGLPVANDARKKLNELMARPEARKAIDTANKESQASASLAEAEKLRAAKKNEAAYGRFKQIAKAFAGTPSGAKAAAAVKEYESDKAFMAALASKQAGGKAKAALSVARSYAKSGRLGDAAKKYKAIIKDYPDTEYARTAEREMNALQR